MAAVGLAREGEVVVSFNPLQLEGHAELVEVRKIALRGHDSAVSACGGSAAQEGSWGRGALLLVV